jgi:flagellar motility protein MotE (MotC chaperone)
MTSRVRLLPVLIGAAGVLMTFKVTALAEQKEPAAQTEAAPAETPPADAATPPAPAGAEPPSTGKAPATGEAAAPAEKAQPAEGAAAPAEAASAAPIPQAQTKGEAEVYRNLADRRAALDARERDLAVREQLLNVSEKGIAERLAELKALEERLNVMLAKRDEEEEVQLTSLVKTYENMKPTDAARIFNKLDRQVLLSVAARMKPAKIGAVMAAMEPARAQDLTVMLARRLSMPRPQPAAALAPPAPVEQPALPSTEPAGFPAAEAAPQG